MKSSAAPRFTLALSTALLALAAHAPPARAQGEPVGTEVIVKPTTPKTTPPRGPRGGPKVRYVTAPPKIVKVTPTTGSLTVVAEPNALVEIEYLRTNEAVQSRVGAAESAVIFNDLRAGAYRVSAALDGHTSDEKEVVVERNRTGKVELSLPPITYDVTVSLNVPAGRVMYWKDGGGESMFRPVQNGVARLPALRPGKYAVRVEPTDKTYIAADTSIEVSEKKTSHAVVLRRKLTAAEFNWASANDWSLPAGWRVAAGKIAVDGRGVALPREDDFRYYQDFQLSADVRMLDGVAASFALRAQNALNYYLIQLTGANADEPYVLRGSIVRNGVPERFGRALSLRHVAATLKQGRFFRVLLTMKDSAVEVRAEDSETGEVVPLGTLTDAGETYPIGAVGIASPGGERNEVAQFVVCTPTCSAGKR